MRLRQLKFLVAVYEEGTFTAAADRMHATQSGISAQIKLLEESLNAKLFERSVSGVIPTPAGTLAYHRATHILRDTSALIADIGELQGRVTGTVSAGLMPTTTRSIIAPVLEKYASRFPDVDVRIEEAYSATLCQGVTAGRLDFALVPPSDSIVGLRSTHLESDVEVFVTAPTECREHMESIDLTSVEPVKLVLPGPNNARRAKIEERIKTFNIPVKKIMELDAMMATLDLVARSDWTTILPGCLLVDDIASANRFLHPIEKPEMYLDYILIERASTTLTPAAQLFRAELQSELTEVCNRSRTLLGTKNQG